MDKFYNAYWSRRIENEEGGNAFNEHRHFQLKWPKLRKYIPKDEGAFILDFGCGDGEIIKEMIKINPKAKYLGLDVSDTALERASASLPGVEFHKIEDGSTFPLTDNSVDFIFASEVIEHVYDTEKVFSEIARVLRRGGQILITTPYHGFVKNLFIVFIAFDKHFDPTGPHIRFFSKRSLYRLLKKAGLKPVAHGYFGRSYPIPHCIFVLATKTQHKT
jgi:ubiquinone/menaquinone biosynthesis C-methylase UbiE